MTYSVHSTVVLCTVVLRTLSKLIYLVNQNPQYHRTTILAVPRVFALDRELTLNVLFIGKLFSAADRMRQTICTKSTYEGSAHSNY